MKRNAGGRAAKRLPVTRERIFAAARTLADRSGIEAVTMRAVASRLDVEAMSLYKHVRDKDDLLDGLIELVMQELEPPPVSADWRSGLRLRARGMRTVLLRHRWASMLIESRTTPTPARLRHHEASLRLLREAGFSVELAYNAILSLDSYIYGFVAQEVWWPFEPEERPELGASLAPHISPAEYPHLIEMISFVMGRAAKKEGRASSTAAGYQADFDFGLELLIDGLARAASPRKRR
ncbi:TetR/AcrR family transcriptional regulator [Myxococcus stipitatus]|uniref:TetR/AcrR family transcriptional regulator n=1 Tax=Myxococcus stipitatus TaxID=83455 RepID=UPI0031456196